MCISGGSRYLCTGGVEKVVKIWDLKMNKLHRELKVTSDNTTHSARDKMQHGN